MALFGCSFAHGQQEDDTTSIPAFGKLTFCENMDYNFEKFNKWYKRAKKHRA
jgi:hypothetical protein